jgi:hypothetical protein
MMHHNTVHYLSAIDSMKTLQASEAIEEELWSGYEDPQT